MCDRDALKPAEKVFKTSIFPVRTRRKECPKHLFPPEGKGIYEIEVTGEPARKIVERLTPLLTPEYLSKWRRMEEMCR